MTTSKQMPSSTTNSRVTGIKLLWSLTILLASVEIASAQNYPIKTEVGLSTNLYAGNIVFVVKDLELNLNSIRINGYFFNSGTYYSTMSDRILVVSVADQLNQKPRMGGISTNSSINLQGGQRRDFWIDVPRETTRVDFRLIINSSNTDATLWFSNTSGSFGLRGIQLDTSLERAYRQELDGFIAGIQREDYDRFSRLYFESPADFSSVTSTLDEMANKFGYSSFFDGNPELTRLLDSTQTVLESPDDISISVLRKYELDAMSRQVRGRSLLSTNSQSRTDLSTPNDSSANVAVIALFLMGVLVAIVIIVITQRRKPTRSNRKVNHPTEPDTSNRRQSTREQRQVPPSRPRQREAIPPSVSLALEFFDLELPVSETELKAVYRRSMQQYHPDRVANLGEELQELAAKRSKTINEAYSLIKKYLGY